ncbi:MAG: LysM peptidoglycan-binding domain-containing protein [Chloroflexota bacterium]
MSEITHQEARARLQRAADQLLDPAGRSTLDVHLAECRACYDYARRLADLETGLRGVLHAQWDSQRPSFDAQTILHSSRAKPVWDNFPGLALGMGKAALAAAFLLGFILVANLVGSRLPMAGRETPASLPTPSGFVSVSAASPTPSIPLTLTEFSAQACDPVVYVVQTGDSLESIANLYEMPEAIIMEFNHLATAKISPGVELSIPVCRPTPSFTAITPDKTTTITPLGGTVISLQRD